MKSDSLSPPYAICIAGEDIPIVVVRRPKSRRIVVRYRPLAHHIRLTLPRQASIRQGLNFVQEKEEWLARQLVHKAQRVFFAHGQVIPLFGRPYELLHAGGRGTLTVQDGKIIVHGQPEFMARRVEDWLKCQAKTAITALAQEKAQQIGRRIKRITIRDTHSHWGSCSSSGALSFSWRLIFAPREVLEYVVCHEVAHLAEHNHSRRFWALVEQLCPEWQKHYHWIKKEGLSLYRFGSG